MTENRKLKLRFREMHEADRIIHKWDMLKHPKEQTYYKACSELGLVKRKYDRLVKLARCSEIAEKAKE
jgi:hypothetical protein